MTGDKAGDGQDQVAVWWFCPGEAITRCAVMVFRPNPDRPQDSAATAAQFYILAGRNGSRLATFVVNQATDPGSWVGVGAFPVNQNGIAVQLVNRGVPATAGARLAITQVKVSCTN
jgi:hypothetical protein